MKEKIAIISVMVNLFLAVGKIIVGLTIKSSAIIAEGIHSGMDVFSSFISLFGIKASKKPKDGKHPYGYYKFEVMSGLIITIFLLLAGVWTIYEAIMSFINPSIINFSFYGIIIMILSVVLNEVMARLKIYYGKKENSLSLLSDGVHDRVDVYTSIAVLIGIIIMPYWIYIDSILAFLIGIYILKESFELGKEATDSLLDVSAGNKIEDKIRNIAKEENINLSDMKTQKKGSVVTANLEIKLPKEISVEKATDISDRFRQKLTKAIENLSYIAIQISSHDMEKNFFQSIEKFAGFNIGNKLQWVRKGRFVNTVAHAKGSGPGGECVCLKCGYTTKHKSGVPCAKMLCPKCKIHLSRK